MDFNTLISSIEFTHRPLSRQAVKQVNHLQTIRNTQILQTVSAKFKNKQTLLRFIEAELNNQ